jgi:hypothetical protein
MNPFEQCGHALFGPNWLTPMADLLGISRSSVQDMKQGRKPVHHDFWLTISYELSKRHRMIGKTFKMIWEIHIKPQNISG